MANRYLLNQFSYSTAVPVHALATVSIGASGAPTIATGTGSLITISRSSAGVYLITLGKKYAGLIGAKVMFFAASEPAAPIVCVTADAVSSAGTLTIKCLAVDGTTATDPASGEKMYLDIVLQNSSVSY